MSYTVYYHTACKAFTGRAYSPLCILEAGKATYEIKGLEEKPAEALAFAPPFVTFPDGFTMGQTSSLCIALGEELGLAPDEAHKRKALQLVNDVADLISDAVGKKGSERIMKWVIHFEKALDGTYFCGDKVTYVDYCAMGAFAYFPGKAEKGSEDFKGVEMTPKLKAWFEMMSEDEAVKKVTGISPYLPDSYY